MYTQKELDNIDPPPITYNGKRYDYYQCTQKQRQMETAIRKTKRDIIGADASGDTDTLTAKSILLRQQKNITNFQMQQDSSHKISVHRFMGSGIVKR